MRCCAGELGGGRGGPRCARARPGPGGEPAGRDRGRPEEGGGEEGRPQQRRSGASESPGNTSEHSFTQHCTFLNTHQKALNTLDHSSKSTRHYRHLKTTLEEECTQEQHSSGAGGASDSHWVRATFLTAFKVFEIATGCIRRFSSTGPCDAPFPVLALPGAV